MKSPLFKPIFRNFKFDVVFSFAEEDNVFVNEVAGHLKGRNLDHYYYKEAEIEAWGKDLKRHISSIYSRQSRLCVIFVSEAYKVKVWTQFEIQKGRVRAGKSTREYILPFKMDDTELREISSMVKYLSLKACDSKQLADAIYEKVIEHRENDTLLNWLTDGLRVVYSHWYSIVATIILSLVGLFLTLADQLTPVDTLTSRLYERNKKMIPGSICKDGSFSKKRGQGTCSYLSGVLMQKDSLMPTMTLQECSEKAKEISWIP